MNQRTRIVRIFSLFFTVVMLYSSLGMSVLSAELQETQIAVETEGMPGTTSTEVTGVTQPESNMTQLETPGATQPESDTTQSETPGATQPESDTTQSETPGVTQTESDMTQTEPPSETQSETGEQAETLQSESETETTAPESESEGVGDFTQNMMPQRPNLAPPIAQDSEGESESESESESEAFEEEMEISAAVREFLDAAAALPETIAEENAEEVERLLTVCDAAYQKLTEEEKALPEVEEAFARVQRLLGLENYAVEYKGQEIEIDEIVYTFDFEPDTKTAVLKDVKNPEAPVAVSIPDKVNYADVEYAVRKLDWSTWGDRCPNITALVLPESLTAADVSFNKFPVLTEVTIPGSVVRFGGSFQNMEKLTTITFELGVQEITSSSMVLGCAELTTVNLPNTLTTISESYTFSDASKLKYITLPANVQIDGFGMFSNCTSLEVMNLPASVTEIAGYMFKGCTGLQSVTADAAIIAVGDSAFDGCEVLGEIPDLSGVESVGAAAFRYCEGLKGKEINLSSLGVISENAFHTTYAQVSALSPNLQSIGESALRTCSIAGNADEGNTLEFPDTLTSVGRMAFTASTLPKKVILPDSVTAVTDFAFYGTKGVEELWLGSGITDIKQNAFKQMTTLKKIVVNNSEDDITGAKYFPTDVEIEYLVESIDDVGDKISDDKDAPTLQEAVNDSKDGEVIKLEKHVKLSKTLMIPAGKNVTISSKEPYTIIGEKGRGIEELVQVKVGASVTFGGQVTVSARYNRTAAIASGGQVRLTENAVVTGGNISVSGGVIDVSGSGAGFVMDGGKVEKNSVSQQFSAPIKISNGASVQIQGGVIQNNKVIGWDNANSSAGILLHGNSSGEMTGGTITGNRAYRGSALVLSNIEGDGKTTFRLSGGDITGNTWTKENSSLRGAGAVYLEGTAVKLEMNGGNITGNSGEQGGGVSVFDAAFVMSGGTISGNTAANGGGIYSFSDQVELLSGNITGNTASTMGGGVYSEGNAEAYSTLHMKNVFVSGNTATQGGGLWLCPTGDAKVHVKNGGIIYGNAASGAGDDVLSAPSGGSGYSLTLADRVPGGGRVLWYTDGSVYMLGSGMYPSIGDEPRYNENSETNTVKEMTKGIALKAIIGSEAASLAQGMTSLTISGNTAKYGGGVGANGGVVIGEDSDSMDIPVEKHWEHGENPEESRPASIDVSLYNESGVLLETMTLNAENNWRGVFAGLPIGTYTIEEEAVPGYTTEMTGSSENGFVITNTFIPVPKGELTVTKIVDGTAGDKSAIFHFTVTLNDKTISGEYGGMTFEEGVATFSLKHGERKTASGLPVGVTYEVTEQEANQNGYTTSVIEASGTITEEGSMATFINKKDAEETEPPTEPETESETESESETETETESEPETETETETETEIETESGSETETEPETETETKPGSGTSNDPGTPNKSVKTGDESRPMLWLTLLGISGIALISLLAVGKVRRAGKRRKQ